MRLNWHSNAPWGGTGYANQTKIFTPRLKALGHDVSITAFWGLQGGMIDAGGIRVYPNGHHPYGQDIIGASAMMDRADVVISLMDVWVMQPQNIPPSIAWHPWFPIDTEPLAKSVLDKAKLARKGITMSKFGQRMAKEAGLDTFYVPHGVETEIFKPLDRMEARGRLQWPKDKFIVGMVAANKGVPPRKSFFEQIMAFAALHKAHPDTMLYLHTDDGKRGGAETVQLASYCEALGLTYGYQGGEMNVDVLFPDQYSYLLGLPDAYMNDCYNAMDVHMLASMGEGFGIPLIEAQAAGTPVITGEWTAMGELCFGGWKIPKSEAKAVWNPYFEAWQWSVSPEAVVDRLIRAYDKRGNVTLRDEARKGAMKYDAARVTEKYWKPVLAEIERMKHDRLDRSTEGRVGMAQGEPLAG